jgi:uncharacterized protein YrrD
MMRSYTIIHKKRGTEMLQPLANLIGNTLHATDGDLGLVQEFYFDDTTWTIRYMVAGTGNWLSGRKVLIALAALEKSDWNAGTFSVNLSCTQVRDSPATDTQKPVYRQHEIELHSYYRWPFYWGGAYGDSFGLTPYPPDITSRLQEISESSQQEDPHLRSTRQLIGYHIHASDGEIGHLSDFVVDEDTWKLSYIIVDTGNWLMSIKVLIAVNWVNTVKWSDEGVYLNLSREVIRSSPEFDPMKTILRNYGALPMVGAGTAGK